MDAYFQTLQDAVTLVDHKVNLFAVVIESGFCRKSLGTGNNILFWSLLDLSCTEISLFPLPFVIVSNGISIVCSWADFYITLRVVDKSHWWYGIPVNFFTENLHELPHVASAGDIIRLTKVTVTFSINQMCALLFSTKVQCFF